MRTRSLLVAVAIAAAAIIPTTANAATLRVVSDGANVFGATATTVASATSYVDSKGTTHRLKAGTALGQLVETGLPYTAIYDAAYDSPYLTRLTGVTAPAGGYWALFINGRMSMLAADDLQLKASDHVLWLVDSDYSSANGPYAYGLSAKVNANGSVTFLGTRIGGAKPIIAGGAPLWINGAKYGNLDANGLLTVTPPGAWTAEIPAKRKIAASETLAG